MEFINYKDYKDFQKFNQLMKNIPKTEKAYGLNFTETGV